MSNIARITRTRPITREVAFTGGLYQLTATRGKMAISQASKTDLGVEAPGAVVGDHHFLLAATDDAAPVRYLALGVVPTGTDAGNVNARLVVEQWHPDAEQWLASPELDIIGATRRFNYGGIKSGIFHVPVHDGCTHGRIYISGLVGNQGVDVVITPGQHDSHLGTSLGYHEALEVILGIRELAAALPGIEVSAEAISGDTTTLISAAAAALAEHKTSRELLAELIIGQRMILTHMALWTGHEINGSDAVEL